MRGLGTIKWIVTENQGVQWTPLTELCSKRCLSSSVTFRSGQQAIPLLPNPKDIREAQLSHHTLTPLDLLSVLHESYSWCLVYCTSVVSISEQLIAASLPHGTLIKFKATWCDFNLNVNLMCFPFILLWCALSREMLQAQICPLSCFSVLVPGFVWWIFLNKNCCSA